MSTNGGVWSRSRFRHAFQPLPSRPQKIEVLRNLGWDAIRWWRNAPRHDTVTVTRPARFATSSLFTLADTKSGAIQNSGWEFEAMNTWACSDEVNPQTH